ncbi:MAG: three-Cys-motif partner protein TcmP [Terriglobia bacterium]
MANTIRVEDDGLVCPEVGAWAEEKYRLMAMYATVFSTGMKNKWDERIYVDLYAGAGYSRVRETNTVLAASPILALLVADPFDKYIFCEKKNELLAALKLRVAKTAPAAKVSFVLGDCNQRVDEICKEIPVGSPQRKVLTLCFVDPFNIGIKFQTLRRLSSRRVDFLVLLAVYMDANLNYPLYTTEESRKIDEFLGYNGWRSAWTKAQQKRVPFPKFLARQFAERMETLGYLPQELYNMKLVRSDENHPLYYLALFSRHKLAYSFWKDVLSYSTSQPRLPGMS